MKRIFQKLSRLAGDVLQHSSAASVALLYAAVRGLRLLPDDLPGQIVGTVTVLEWVFGCLGLAMFLMDKFYFRTEKEHG